MPETTPTTEMDVDHIDCDESVPYEPWPPRRPGVLMPRLDPEPLTDALLWAAYAAALIVLVLTWSTP